MNPSIEITKEAFDSFSEDELKRIIIFSNALGYFSIYTIEYISSYLKEKFKKPIEGLSNSQIIKMFFDELGLSATNTVCVYFDPADGYKVVYWKDFKI